MNVKKIFKGVVSLGVLSGTAYLAYKIGEKNGEVNEKLRKKYDDEDEEDFELDEDDDEYDFYDTADFDEPDDECIAPSDYNSPNVPYEKYEDNKDFSFSGDNSAFAPISTIMIEGITEIDLCSLLFQISHRKYISNKTIRDIIGVNADKSAEVLSALYDAGYIASAIGNRIPVRLTVSDYLYLLSGESK